MNKQLKLSDLLPLLRIALTGTMKGPDVFETAAVLGREETIRRLRVALHHFHKIKNHE